MRRMIVILCMVIFMAGEAHADKRPCLVFGVSDTASGVVNAYKGFLEKAYDPLGYDIEILRIPTKRAYSSADLEKTDGLLIATEAIVGKYKNLVLVPVSLGKTRLMVYTKEISFKVDGPKSLRPYRIGFLRGYLLSRKMTESMDRQIVNTYQSLFSMLQKGRVDIVLGLKRESDRYLAAHPEFSDIKALEPPLVTLILYHCINKRHKDLIPRLVPVMKALMDEKLLERLYAPYEE